MSNKTPYDIENKPNISEKTSQKYIEEGYVAVSKGCNYKKCCILLFVILLICLIIVCCLCSISGFLLFRYIIFSQTPETLLLNITNTTLQLTNIPTYYPADMPSMTPTFFPSYAPTIEIPQ